MIFKKYKHYRKQCKAVNIKPFGFFRYWHYDRMLNLHL